MRFSPQVLAVTAILAIHSHADAQWFRGSRRSTTTQCPSCCNSGTVSTQPSAVATPASQHAVIDSTTALTPSSDLLVSEALPSQPSFSAPEVFGSSTTLINPTAVDPITSSPTIVSSSPITDASPVLVESAPIVVSSPEAGQIVATPTTDGWTPMSDGTATVAVAGEHVPAPDQAAPEQTITIQPIAANADAPGELSNPVAPQGSSPDSQSVLVD